MSSSLLSPKEALEKAASSTAEAIGKAVTTTADAVEKAVENLNLKKKKQTNRRSRSRSPAKAQSHPQPSTTTTITNSISNDFTSNNFNDSMMDASEKNVQGLLVKLERATRYSVLKLRGLMASITEREEDEEEVENIRKRIEEKQKQKQQARAQPNNQTASAFADSTNTQEVLQKLQKASRNSVLELRGMLASINTISNSITDRIRMNNGEEEDEEDDEDRKEEKQIRGLLESVRESTTNSEREVQQMLESLEKHSSTEFAPLDYRYMDTAIEQERWAQLHQACRESVTNLKEILVQVEKISSSVSTEKKKKSKKQKSSLEDSLSQSIREQLTITSTGGTSVGAK